jgi:hypothetical protein
MSSGIVGLFFCPERRWARAASRIGAENPGGGLILSVGAARDVEVEGWGLGFEDEDEDDIPLLDRKFCIEFHDGARGFMVCL